jgi:Fur family transcriptional regulator, ferric uptake regulator
MNGESLFNLLRQHRLRLTATRQALLASLLKASSPQSYDDLKASTTMDKATFYRNMNTFESIGIVRRIESDDRKWYFEIATAAHAHFICEQCHRIECLKAFPMDVP